VVDWELSTIGDPVADIAMTCAYRHPAFDLVLGFPAAWTSPVRPSAHELASRYVAAGGADLHHWDFHRALAHYKIAVIGTAITRRRADAVPARGGDMLDITAYLAGRPYGGATTAAGPVLLRYPRALNRRSPVVLRRRPAPILRRSPAARSGTRCSRRGRRSRSPTGG